MQTHTPRHLESTREIFSKQTHHTVWAATQGPTTQPHHTHMSAGNATWRTTPVLSRAPSQHGNQREKERDRCSREHRAETVKREKEKEAGAHGSAGPNQRKVKAITPVLSRAPSTPSEQREKKTGRCSCEHRADTTKRTRDGARESTAPPPPNHNERTIHPGTAQPQQEWAEGKAMKRMNTGMPAHSTQTCECTGTNPHQPSGWGVHGHQEKVNRAQTTGAQRNSPTRDTRACNAPRKGGLRSLIHRG